MVCGRGGAGGLGGSTKNDIFFLMPDVQGKDKLSKGVERWGGDTKMPTKTFDDQSKNRGEYSKLLRFLLKLQGGRATAATNSTEASPWKRGYLHNRVSQKRGTDIDSSGELRCFLRRY